VEDSVIADRLAEIEALMQRPDFWLQKEQAQQIVKEYQELKEAALGVGKYDKREAILTIFAGAGGDDAEDFVRILFNMYQRFIERQGWFSRILHDHETDHGGYRTVTLEVDGKNAYGMLKNESGVHRLVRISPFSATKKRHTSFAMVEFVPKFEEIGEIDIPEGDIRVEFAKSSGAGGQNVNKRETAVRVIHIPTNISVHISSERSQQQNRQKALALLTGKLYHVAKEQRKKEEQGLSVSSTVAAEWGSQIRSYVFHPYQLVKDHRTNVELRDVDRVLDGDLDAFIEAEARL
jgi:peptide chain release factor 2